MIAANLFQCITLISLDHHSSQRPLLEEKNGFKNLVEMLGITCVNFTGACLGCVVLIWLEVR